MAFLCHKIWAHVVVNCSCQFELASKKKFVLGGGGSSHREDIALPQNCIRFEYIRKKLPTAMTCYIALPILFPLEIANGQICAYVYVFQLTLLMKEIVVIISAMSTSLLFFYFNRILIQSLPRKSVIFYAKTI